MLAVNRMWSSFPHMRILGPRSLMGAAKNPAIHVFGFNDKHAVFRDDDVVNLGRSIGGGQRDIA